MVFTSSIRKQGRKILYISKKRICITGISHVNTSKSNNPNIYNSDDVIGNSSFSRINVHTKRSSNEIVTLQRETDNSQVIVSMRKICMTTTQVKN